MVNERMVRRIISEELTKSQVEKLVDDRLDKKLGGKKHEEEMRRIVADVLDDFFKNLWARNNFWKSLLK